MKVEHNEDDKGAPNEGFVSTVTKWLGGGNSHVKNKTIILTIGWSADNLDSQL